MKKTNKTVLTIGWVSLLLATMIFVIRFVSFHESFYEKEYKKCHVSEITGLSDDDLMDVTTTLFAYLKDERSDLLIKKDVFGTNRYVFTGRENMHMKDVKDLYTTTMLVGRILFLIGVVCLFVQRNRSDYFFEVKQSYYKGLYIVGLFFAGIAIYAIADFNAFWLNFHYLLFDNTYFFLDPNESILVNMVPDQFFSDLVRTILLMYACILLGIYGMIPQINKIRKRRKIKNA